MANKIFLIGDFHLSLGFPNKVDKWFKVSQEYCETFLFPLMEKELDKDDIIVQLGDLFDNRDVVPINILNYAQDILERMASICPVHVLIGNHDIYTKSTNDINSLKSFKHIPNVNIYEKPERIEFNNKSILMMPWIEKKSDQVEVLKENSGSDFLFCHSDLNGARMHLNSVAHKNLHKIDVEDFDGYKGVYSGHIHILQRNKNFTFVGSVHEMDRNDIDNQKGIFILDTDSDTEKFVPNNVSPKFKKVYLRKEDDIDSLDKINKKDWIDLFISNSLLINNRKLRRKIEGVLETGNFTSVEYIDDITSKTEEVAQVDITSILNEGDVLTISNDYKDIIQGYISNMEWDNKKIKSGVLDEFGNILRIYEDNYKNKK